MTSSTGTVPASLNDEGAIQATPPHLEEFLQSSGLKKGDAQGPIAPGQEGLLLEHLQEQGLIEEEKPADSPNEQLLAGKFKSAEELERGYKELERKLGAQGQQPAAEPAPQADTGIPDPAAYTPERGEAEYGEQLAAAFTAAEINPYQLWADAAGGKDTSAEAAAIAEHLGIAPAVVAGYIASNVSPAATAGASIATPAELTEADGVQLRALVGGDGEFQKLAEWVKVHATDDLPAYQQAVDTGNKPAITAWLKAFQARRDAGMTVEPKLEGGGNAPGVDRFGSREEIRAAMNKRNDRGQRLYDVDHAYQRKFVEKLARSPDFA